MNQEIDTANEKVRNFCGENRVEIDLRSGDGRARRKMAGILGEGSAVRLSRS